MVQRTAAAPKSGALNGPRSRYRPIDMMHLAKQTLGDRGLELEVLRMFDQTVKVYFERLERATTVDELLRHLHTLKGAAAGVGARAIADLAAAAEAEIREGRPVNPERIDDLEMAIVECSAFIEAALADAEE
jgi:HPt (histidine-containing phosphotransfer) domain-containing protein